MHQQEFPLFYLLPLIIGNSEIIFNDINKKLSNLKTKPITRIKMIAIII
jgi:hypothetical protein